jgi:hypothetical protein
MEFGIAIALALSVLFNVFLFVRNIIWKNRAEEMSHGISVTNNRLKLTFNLLWAEAESRGATDKNEFTGKLLALSEVPEQLLPLMLEKVEILPKAKTTAKLGF